jgi:cobalt-zinc-cadmium efflux system membrane fusion protein
VNNFRMMITPALLSILITACGRNETETVSAASAGNSTTLETTADQMKSLRTATASLQTVPTTEQATGKVSFSEDAITPVYSPYPGRVVELLAKAGDSVTKGAPLLVIDSPEVVSAEGDWLSGRATLTKAQAILKQAERSRERIEKLVAGEAAAPKDLEQASTDLEGAHSDVHSAEAQIESSRQRLLNFGKTEAQIEQLGLTRRVDRTTRVTAPIGGLIVGRKVGPGQYIRPDNPDPLFTIADTSTMWLLAQVYESQIPSMHIGQRVEVRVPALPQLTLPAQVNYIAPSIDPATRRVAVRCVVRNRNNQLKPEMFASFRFEKAARQVMNVPQQSVVREGNIAVVWVVESPNRITRRTVELGAELDGKIEIQSGLRPGEIVVADGALFLSSFVKG